MLRARRRPRLSGQPVCSEGRRVPHAESCGGAHVTEIAHRSRRSGCRRHRDADRPGHHGRAARAGPRPQADLDRGRQDRLRHRSLPTEQRVVHAAGRADQRGLLPRHHHAQRARARAARQRRRRVVRRPRLARHDHDGQPTRLPQSPVHPGARGRGRALPPDRDAPDRPGARLVRRPGAAGVARRRPLPAADRARPGARQHRDGRPCPDPRPCPGRARRPGQHRVGGPAGADPAPQRVCRRAGQPPLADRAGQRGAAGHGLRGDRSTGRDEGGAGAGFRAGAGPGALDGAAHPGHAVSGPRGGLRPGLARLRRHPPRRAGQRGHRRGHLPRLGARAGGS